jgi:hypothetical protein
MKKRLLMAIGLLSFVVTQNAFCQTYPRPEIDLENFVLNLFGSQEEDLNYDDLYESLFQFYRDPINLNTATRSQLQSLYLLTEAQINAIFKHIETTGKLISIYELQAVEGFNPTVIQKILPFVTVRDEGLASDARSLWKRMKEEENHYLILLWSRQLAEKKGYTPALVEEGNTPSQRYVGSPDRFYARYRMAHTGDFTFGLTVEKDAGENIIWDPKTKRHLMDFYSFHAGFYNRGKFKTIMLGDYTLQFGQGVLLAGGFAVGKGAETTATVRRSTRGILPYTSVLEAGFFRGAAATYDLGKVKFTGFLSSTQQDANLSLAIDSLKNNEQITNYIQRTGFHRTPNEIAAKNSLGETNYGANLNYTSTNKRLSAGLTALRTEFSATLVPSSRKYNQFEFKGRENTAFSADFSYYWQNVSFFGEWARSQSGGIGGVTGAIASLSQKVEAALLYRRFDRNFHSFYGNSFNENTRNINETGLYWGLKIIPNRRWQLAAFYDIFYFPWLRFRVDAPSQGSEMLLRLTHKPTKKIMVFAQYRTETKPRNLPEKENTSSKIDVPTNTTRDNYMLYCEYNDDIFTLKSRVLFSSFSQTQAQYGFAAAQDVSATIGRFEATARVALFQTDSYDTRIYIYENDVLYSFSIPPYFGQGMRSYLMLRYKHSKKLSVWARYSVWSYRNQETIGSGLEEIQDNIRPELKVQVFMKF